MRNNVQAARIKCEEIEDIKCQMKKLLCELYNTKGIGEIISKLDNIGYTEEALLQNTVLDELVDILVESFTCKLCK